MSNPDIFNGLDESPEQDELGEVQKKFKTIVNEINQMMTQSGGTQDQIEFTGKIDMEQTKARGNINKNKSLNSDYPAASGRSIRQNFLLVPRRPAFVFVRRNHELIVCHK